MNSHTTFYESAALYDLAFSYRDFEAEGRFLRDVYQRRRGRPARSFLELAAGPGRHALDMAAAGLDVAALDVVPEMAAYATEAAKARGVDIGYVVADMTAFALPRTFDLAACMLCSASYLLTDDAFRANLSSVRAHLAPGGLYLLELTHPEELDGKAKSQPTWKMRDHAGELEIAWLTAPTDAAGRIWLSTSKMRYCPFDGSAPIEVHDEARQRGFRHAEVVALASEAGMRVVATFGTFDESVELANPNAKRMLVVLEASPS